jgi:hypothetical protein
VPGNTSSTARDQQRARFQELLRRTAPEAERLRQERSRQRDEDGEEE